MFLNRVRDPVLRAQEGDRIDGDGVAEGELLGHGFGKGFPPRGLAVSDREDDFQRRVQGKEVWVDFAGGGVDGGAVAPETVRDGGEALRVGLPGGGVGFGPDKGAEGVAVRGVVETFLRWGFFLTFNYGVGAWGRRTAMWWQGSKPRISRAALRDDVPVLGRPAPMTWRVSPASLSACSWADLCCGKSSPKALRIRCMFCGVGW